MKDAPGVRERLVAFIRKQFPRARSRDLDDDASLIETGIVDSLGVLDLVNFLESELGLVVEDDDLTPENFRSIAAITGFVERRFARGEPNDGTRP